MRARCLYIMILCCAAFTCHAQLWERSVHTVHLTAPDYSTQAEVADEEHTFKPKLHLIYYWIRSQEIHCTRGDYQGKLLHGEFAIYNRDNKLITKGAFKNGLKNGVWKTWYPSGELQTLTTWRNGRRNGSYIEYDEEGTQTMFGSYRNEQKQGKWMIRNASGNYETVLYKKDEEVQPKPNLKKWAPDTTSSDENTARPPKMTKAEKEAAREQKKAARAEKKAAREKEKAEKKAAKAAAEAEKKQPKKPE